MENEPTYLPSKGNLAAEIAAGTYTKIVGIYGPSEAGAGETVNIDVAVKNTWTGSFYVTVTGRYDGANITPSVDYLNIGPGKTVHFYFDFTMPNKDITLDVWSFFWAEPKWIEDDHMTVDIDLATLEPAFRGFGVTDYSQK